MFVVGLIQQSGGETSLGGTTLLCAAKKWRATRRRHIGRFAFGSALALVIMQASGTDTIAATRTYEASAGTLPSAQGWTHFSSGLPESNYSVSAGSLLQGPTDPDTNIQGYKSSGINFDFARDTIVATSRLQIISSGLTHPPDPTGQGFRRAGWNLQVTDEQGRLVVLFVGSTGFFLLGQNSESSGLVAFDTTTAFHDYRLTVNSSGASLTVDGTPMGSLTFAQLRTDGAVDANTMHIGDRTLAQASSSRLSSFSLSVSTGQLLNISTRLRVQTGDNVLIGGFIVTGTQPKKVIVRAIGPSLPVVGKLADPTLELFGPGGQITSNDNWRTGRQEAEIIASTVPPTNDLESAVVATLPANGTGYTAIVRGAEGNTGIGLVEVYDLERSAASKLANISTRGFVQTGDDVMIGGFILGPSPTKVIVRAIGPSLPVPGKLADPTLELFNENGVSIGTNNNWRTGGQEAEIIASTVPPPNDLESAIVATLPPTPHTVIVRGNGGTPGVALVEVYSLD